MLGTDNGLELWVYTVYRRTYSDSSITEYNFSSVSVELWTYTFKKRTYPDFSIMKNIFVWRLKTQEMLFVLRLDNTHEKCWAQTMALSYEYIHYRRTYSDFSITEYNFSSVSVELWIYTFEKKTYSDFSIMTNVFVRRLRTQEILFVLRLDNTPEKWWAQTMALSHEYIHYRRTYSDSSITEDNFSSVSVLLWKYTFHKSIIWFFHHRKYIFFCDWRQDISSGL